MIKVIMKVTDIKENTTVYKLRGETPYTLRRSVTFGDQVIKSDVTNGIQDALLVSTRGDAYSISGDKELVVIFDCVYSFLDYIEYNQ